MQHITDIESLHKLKSNSAVFILFGGSHCSVCRSLLPQLSAILKEKFPDMHAYYVDCEQAPEICAQHSVFSLPVVKAYIDGMKIVEVSRVFSVKKLVQDIERPYQMWNDAKENK